MAEKIYSFAVDKVERLNLDKYPEDEFAVVRLGFLSTAPNAHELRISEDVLRESAKTALGKFVVAKIWFDDTMGHENDQDIFGYVPETQDIEFTQEGEYLRASCLAVISKRYAEEFCNILERDKEKSVSVEMTVTSPEEDKFEVLSFRIFGITVLGEKINPSCPDSSISIVKFSEEKATNFYNKINIDSNNPLYQFAEERRKQFMAEDKKTYKVDKSKDSMSTGSWGDVDKATLRNKIMDSKNRESLVKDVYMLVEDGWEETPSEHLKYPVMEFKGDTLVYNRDGLASALGYAKKENESSVITKVEKIYKKLDLDEEGKEKDTKMSKEIKFSAVDIGDMWGKVWTALHNKYPDGEWGSVYRIDGIYEEDNKKFAVIRHRDEDGLYRLDFSLTEDGLTLSDEITKVEIEIKETDEVRKFAEPEDSEKFKKFEDEIEGRKAWAKVIKKVQDHEGKDTYVDSIEKNHIIYTKDDVRYRVDADVETDPDDKSVDAKIKWDSVKKDADQKMSDDEHDDDDKDKDDEDDVEKMSGEEIKEKFSKMKSDIEERDNIIMDKDKELEELRKFKAAIDEREKASSVESVMADIKDCLDDTKFNELRDEGLNCDMANLDAWSNKAKAVAFSSVKKPALKKNSNGVWEFSAPINKNKTPSASVWDRLKNSN